MKLKNDFSFPRTDNLEMIKEFYAGINGGQSFDPVQQHQSDIWSAEVHCSRGEVLEKAGFAMIEMTGGTVEDVPTDITLLQTVAWPANPCIPGFIIMSSASKGDDQNIIVTFYADLIIQNSAARQEDKSVFTDTLRAVCDSHGQGIEEYQAFLSGRGMLGGCAGECGILYFFEESDAALLESIIQEALKAYQQIISAGSIIPSEKDFAALRDNRKKIAEWMVSQDYGVKVARQNNIPMELMETYGFPPKA